MQSLLTGCASTDTLQANMQEQLGTEQVSMDTESASEVLTEQSSTEDYIDAASVAKRTEEDYEKYAVDGDTGTDETTVNEAEGSKTATPETSSSETSNDVAANADDQTSDDDQNKTDKYETDPIPEGKPDPVEPDEVAVDDTVENTCTLYIECSTILDHMDELDATKTDLVPADGVILAQETVTFYEGESVFDVLLRETQNHRIHMEYSFTPGYNSSYIEGIGNLYEFDCGELSGWMFCVNGWYPNYGCSRYQVQAGDTIEWHYTCDLGRDLGASVE